MKTKKGLNRMKYLNKSVIITTYNVCNIQHTLSLDRQTTFIAVSFNNNANSIKSVVVFFTTVNHLSQPLSI